MVTVYASVGNSDDKLSQRRWSNFITDFVTVVHHRADQVHGVWHSAPTEAFQNASVCFEIDDPTAARLLRPRLAQLAAEYGQDSIAWAEVATTRFITPNDLLTPAVDDHGEQLEITRTMLVGLLQGANYGLGGVDDAYLIGDTGDRIGFSTLDGHEYHLQIIPA